MREVDSDRPPDSDGPDGRWWDQFDTVAWAAQRHDAHAIDQRQRLFAVLDLLIGRCSAQLYPGGRFTAPSRDTATQIRHRQRHVAAVRDRVTTDPELTLAELQRLLQVYGPLARATHHDPADPSVDERLDRLAGPPA